MDPTTTITNNVVLKFDSNLYGNIRITIPRARMNITESEVRDAMERMIAGGAILSPNFGIPVAVRGAALVSTERTQMI